VTDRDPATDRRLLQESAYRDDENLKARQSIYQFAVGPIDLEWRLGGVDWTGDEAVLDLASCNSGDAMAAMSRPLDEAVCVRDPVVAMVGAVDWPAVVAEFRRLVEDRIAREGAFGFDIVSGVFVCRV
jgi:hypothetical protein